MNKKQLINSVSELLDGSVTKASLKEVIDATFQAMEGALTSGKKVSVSKFGALMLVERQARKGRNPQTGEEIQIAARSSVKFKPAKNLKAAVANVKPVEEVDEPDTDE